MRKHIYLDNAATTRPSPEVVSAVCDWLRRGYGNPSSLHIAGEEAKKRVTESRLSVAKFIGAEANEIVFTAGGSEANNLAIHGLIPALIKSGRRHIITTTIEHHSVLRAFAELERKGFLVTNLPVDRHGYISIRDLHSKLSNETGLVSVMYANNEVGTIHPISEIALLCKSFGAFFHTDAVQAIRHCNINVKDQCVDLLSLSGHKLHALQGVGALYIREGTPLSPIIHGGQQEFGLRAGTENVTGIISLGVVLRKNQSNWLEYDSHFLTLCKTFISGLDEQKIDYRVNVNSSLPRLNNILSLTIKNVESESLQAFLNLSGVCISAASACTAGLLEPSHVLKAMGFSDEEAWCTIRVSFSRYTTEEEVVQAAKAIGDACKDILRITK